MQMSTPLPIEGAEGHQVFAHICAHEHTLARGQRAVQALSRNPVVMGTWPGAAVLRGSREAEGIHSHLGQVGTCASTGPGGKAQRL